jgi:hypothetical protein
MNGMIRNMSGAPRFVEGHAPSWPRCSGTRRSASLRRERNSGTQLEGHAPSWPRYSKNGRTELFQGPDEAGPSKTDDSQPSEGHTSLWPRCSGTRQSGSLQRERISRTRRSAFLCVAAYGSCHIRGFNSPAQDQSSGCLTNP